jgi:2-C-methyl-D-erythritol 4-phosphate cytidylyltransferase
MTRYAIIVAGGSGTRFGANIPKQFLPLGDKLVLMHTISKFQSVENTKIIVVLPQASIEWWQELCQEYSFTCPHMVVAGGSNRFESVNNALKAITPDADDLIAVHDGVRPLVSTNLIEAAYTQAADLGSAIPSVAVTDSIRQLTDGNSSIALSRDSLRAVQTPQTFRAELLTKAYNVPYSPFFTDDASVVENFGQEVHLIEGEVNNLKITHPQDLVIAELLMNSK